MTTLAGIVLHGCGHVAYTSYLDAWGVQADLFPQSADWKVVRGYYAIVLQGIGIVRSVPWRAAALIFFLLSVAIWLYRLPTRPKSKKSNSFLEKRPWLKEFFSSFALGASVIYLIVMLYLVGLLVAIIPGLVGERAGTEQASKEKRRLLGPVSDIDTELWEGDQRKIRGHIIASSSELIAIYDIDLHQVRTLSRGDWEIRRVTP
ncbi:hypothetical protein GIY21_20435 [Xanthomonas sontii]|uniref:Uncharacterized protein n=2 Tax=Xanthomonas sontii TaxID=2650745 RepID=A0A6N7QE41_9XANT|nr:hypothetical protein CEK64_02415 [Xanthomonas sontii]MRH02673.1 hypothetical protein [Xanthomonas sontii]MRH76985.1 hypothetical protein [Xanthomonas sontii]